MATKPSTEFQWATNEGSAITPAPDPTVRATGFGKTFVPFQWLNNMFNHIGKWISWFNQQESAHENSIIHINNSISHINNSISDLYDNYNTCEKITAYGTVQIPFGGFNPTIDEGIVTANIKYVVHRNSLVTLMFPQVYSNSENATSDLLSSLEALPAPIRPAETAHAFVHVVGSGGALMQPGSVEIDTDGYIHFCQFMILPNVSIPDANPVDLVIDQPYFAGTTTHRGFAAFTVTYKAAE